LSELSREKVEDFARDTHAMNKQRSWGKYILEAKIAKRIRF
jgi:hypothetical protein